MMIINGNILMINDTDTDKNKEDQGPISCNKTLRNGHCLFSLI